MSNTLAPPDRARVPSRAARALRRGAEFRKWRARVADLLEALAIASVVLVVGQFLAAGGSHALLSGTVGDRLVAVGRLTGLVAMDLLLIQILMAARLPWVDRVYGMDRALAAHRVLGRITVPLVLVHVLAILVGYAAGDGQAGLFGWLRELLSLVTGDDDLLLALLATAALLAIAVTSVRIARRRLSYEWWHAVHLMAYAAVILAIPHQLSLGTDFASSALMRAYWWTLWIGVAASVAWWRVLLPVTRSVRHGLRVAEVRPEAPGVWSVVLRGRDLRRLDVRAGQFFNWRFVTPRLFFAAHPWSLSAAPDGHSLRITVRALGDHSSRIADLRPGTFVLVEGPYGAFTTRARTRAKVLLIAAGIGVTPVRALLEELVLEGHAAPGDVTVVYRANDVTQLPLHPELERLASLAGHQILSLVGPPATGSALPDRAGGHGSDGERLTRIVPDLAEHEVYLCGPGPWMELVHKAVRDAGVPAAHIHDERFAW